MQKFFKFKTEKVIDWSLDLTNSHLIVSKKGDDFILNGPTGALKVLGEFFEKNNITYLNDVDNNIIIDSSLFNVSNNELIHYKYLYDITEVKFTTR